MNNPVEYTERLDKVLDYLGTMAEKSIDFASEQVPLVAREIVTLHVINGAIQLAVGVLLFVPLVALSVFLWKKFVASQFEEWVIGAVISGILACIAFAQIPIGGYGVLKGVYAPRIVLIEYTTDLVRSK